MTSIAFLTYGDIARVATSKRVLGMAEYLAEAGFSVSIILVDAVENRRQFEAKCPSAALHFFQKGSVFSEVREKNKIIKKIKPDLIYVSSLAPRNLIFPHYRRSSNVIVEHSEIASSILSHGIFKRSIYWVLEKLCHSMFDGQVMASKYLFDKFERRGRSIPSLYLPYAYERGFLKQAECPVPTTEYLERGYQVVIYMGTLVEEYGFLDVLAAARKLKDVRNDVLVIIIGGGRDFHRGLQIVREQGLENEVLMPGFVSESELAAYFRSASVFVAPLYDTVTDWARCPSKLFMYAAFGKPVVTAKVGEAIDMFGDLAFFCDCSSSQSMASAILRALEADAPRNVEYLQREHDWSTRSAVFADWVRMTYQLS